MCIHLPVNPLWGQTVVNKNIVIHMILSLEFPNIIKKEV